MEPKSGKLRSDLQEAVVALLLFLANAKPLVLLIEDLHWIDLESEAILVRLAEAASTGRILFILTCRPEYDRGAFATARPVEIRLSALSAAETGELLDYLVGNDPQLDRLRADLAEVCKGNARNATNISSRTGADDHLLSTAVIGAADFGCADERPPARPDKADRFTPRCCTGPSVDDWRWRDSRRQKDGRLQGAAKRPDRYLWG